MKYSQNNEEDIILKFFKQPVGVFLDIGANDGRTLSNTLALTERGWQGTLVEASPKAFEKLQEEYKGFKNGEHELFNLAVGSFDGAGTFYESDSHLKTGDVGLVSTMKPKELERWNGTQIFKEMMVDVVTFQSLLNMSRHRKFDLLSLDIEGMELEVLPQIDFRMLGITLAVIEWNGKDYHKYEGIMRPQGFVVIAKNPENLIYADKFKL